MSKALRIASNLAHGLGMMLGYVCGAIIIVFVIPFIIIGFVFNTARAGFESGQELFNKADRAIFARRKQG